MPFDTVNAFYSQPNTNIGRGTMLFQEHNDGPRNVIVGNPWHELGLPASLPESRALDNKALDIVNARLRFFLDVNPSREVGYSDDVATWVYDEESNALINAVLPEFFPKNRFVFDDEFERRVIAEVMEDAHFENDGAVDVTMDQSDYGEALSDKPSSDFLNIIIADISAVVGQRTTSLPTSNSGCCYSAMSPISSIGNSSSLADSCEYHSTCTLKWPPASSILHQENVSQIPATAMINSFQPEGMNNNFSFFEPIIFAPRPIRPGSLRRVLGWIEE